MVPKNQAILKDLKGYQRTKGRDSTKFVPNSVVYNTHPPATKVTIPKQLRILVVGPQPTWWSAPAVSPGWQRMALSCRIPGTPSQAPEPTGEPWPAVMVQGLKGSACCTLVWKGPVLCVDPICRSLEPLWGSGWVVCAKETSKT